MTRGQYSSNPVEQSYAAVLVALPPTNDTSLAESQKLEHVHPVDP